MAQGKRFRCSPLAQVPQMTVMFLAATVVGLSLLEMTHAYGDDINNAVADPAKPQMPSFVNSDVICEAVCKKSEGPADDQCAQCMKRKKVASSKRTVRGRRFDDFRLDDYLFMKLLGRNLEDNQ